MIAVAFAQGAVSPSTHVSPGPERTLLAAATVQLPDATPTPAEVGRTPSSTPSEPAQSVPRPFEILNAQSCQPGVVPSATAASMPRVKASRSFALRVPILMYHRIVPFAQAVGSLKSLIVSPEVFSAQLTAAQAAGWHTITAAQLADDLAAGKAVPPRTFVITIDDGWKDGYEFALPILRAHGFVATFYVIAGRIDYGSFLDAWQLRAMISAGNEIGDHSMTHIPLAREAGSGLTYQIDAAAATIAAATGRWPETFAYPLGSFDLATEAAVQACSTMKMAVIEGEATYETWATRFQIPRIRVDDGTAPDALLELMTHPRMPTPAAAPPSARPTGRLAQPIPRA